MKEEYTPIWVVVAAGLMVSSVWFDGVRLVTRNVGALDECEIEDALRAGVRRAQQLLASGLIEGAALRLLGETALVGTTGIRKHALPRFHGRAVQGMMHA